MSDRMCCSVVCKHLARKISSCLSLWTKLKTEVYSECRENTIILTAEMRQNLTFPQIFPLK